LAFVTSAQAAEAPCELVSRAKCFGVQSLEASLSKTQAGDHPDLTFAFEVKQDPESAANVFGLHDAYATTRNVRIELPPGLIGDPNVIGASQQCTVQDLLSFNEPGGGCPNGSQVGTTEILAYELTNSLREPVYMMAPPGGGDVVARLGTIAGIFPVFIDLRVRSEGDYGINAEITDASAEAKLIRVATTTWGVPAATTHNTERCTPKEVIDGCKVSESRPPGSRPLAFLTNPTRCGVPLSMSVSAASWVEPQRFDTKAVSFPEISGCNRLPFGPSLEVEPTSHQAAAPTGLDMTIKLPASEGVNVLEPSQTRFIRIDLPSGLAINTGSADGLATCSAQQARFEEDAAAECPNAAKLADTEFEIPVLERKLKGAIYLREPEPKHPFRIWITADDLGLHVKLPGELEVDKQTGQIHSIVLGAPKPEGIPQAPLREVNLELKSGFRAPLVNPQVCGAYVTHYEFVPWSGGPPAQGEASMTIDEGCGTGRFAPELSAGTVDPTGGKHSTFVFALTREDGEQNPQVLDFSPPTGFAATFAGVEHCEGPAAESGACPPGSRIGRVVAAVGAGPAPLWVPQPGKRPTAVYLGGPYKGAPLSVVAVVPRQAGPFDFGDEVVRSAIYVDPETARATVKADPLPQWVEGIPIWYRTLYIDLDRPNFALNPTSCAEKATEATVVSAQGAVARPNSPFAATDCAQLTFHPRLSLRLRGATHRGAFPRVEAKLQMPSSGANIASTQVILPPSELIENAHFDNVCTRVEFAAERCPTGSVYGRATAVTPLIDEPLRGDVYLRTNPAHELPDLVVALKGPPALPIEIDAVARIDSVHGSIRTSFETVPDAPLTSFRLQMQGGVKGLIVNSTNLCKGSHRAVAKFTAQNGRRVTLRPVPRVTCSKRH
jgi:hypothetical protein